MHYRKVGENNPAEKEWWCGDDSNTLDRVAVKSYNQSTNGLMTMTIGEAVGNWKWENGT